MDPLSHFGFRYLFGSYQHKDILINFLNAFFASLDSELEVYKHTIQDIHYKTSIDDDGYMDTENRPFVGMICSCSDGTDLLLRFEKTLNPELIPHLTRMREEANMATSYIFSSQLYPKFYNLTLLNFKRSDDIFKVGCACLTSVGKEKKEQTPDTYAKFTVTLPLFPDNVAKESVLFDKWIFLLRNLSAMTEIPEGFDEDIFKRVFEVMDCENLSSGVFHDYIRHLDEERNLFESYLNQSAE